MTGIEIALGCFGTIVLLAGGILIGRAQAIMFRDGIAEIGQHAAWAQEIAQKQKEAAEQEQKAKQLLLDT